MNRHVWVLFLEGGDLVAERLSERSGAEDGQRAARSGRTSRSRRDTASKAVARDRGQADEQGQGRQQRETSSQVPHRLTPSPNDTHSKRPRTIPSVCLDSDIVVHADEALSA